MRTYLGDIKTPFNKHRLITRLNAFLRKPETIDRLISLIDRQDARVLTAIALLCEPSVAGVHALFADSTPYLRLHYHLLNLEERLLVYREETESHDIIRINPLFSERITELVVDSSLLFPTVSADPTRTYLSRPSDARVIATVAFLIRAGVVLRADGSLRKKARDRIVSLFHEDNTGREYDGTVALIEALSALGVITASDDGRFSLSPPRWRALCAMTPASRRAHIAAASPTVDSTDHRVLAAAIRSCLAALSPDTAVTDETFERLLRAHGTPVVCESEAASAKRRLLALGLLVRNREGLLLASQECAFETDLSPRSIVVQPTFELNVPFGITAEEAWFVPFVADLLVFDTVSRYEITRNACVRAFEEGISASGIAELTSRLSGVALPRNVRTSLDMWEQEYRSIRVFRGTVIVADENRRHLFEHDKRICDLVERELAPGVYLVRSRAMDEIRRLLRAAGVDPAPRPVLIDRSEDTDAEAALRVPRLENLPEEAMLSRAALGGSSPAASAFDGKRYRETVIGLVGDALSKEQLAELDDRIARKLILAPHQVRDLRPAAEVVEAKGFDFLGKIRLIEQTLAAGDDLLEIVSGGEEKPATITVKPDSLEKEGTDLVLICTTLADGARMRIRVRSVGLLRRRRGSVLG